MVWLEQLLVKTETKKLLSNSLLRVPGNWVSHFFQQRGPTLPLVFFLITDILVEAFLVAFDILGQDVKFCLGFSFPRCAPTVRFITS